MTRHSLRRSMHYAPIVGLALALALPASWGADTSTRADARRYADELARLVNEYRQRQGREPLSTSDKLNELAGRHSARMAEARKLGHEGFEQRFAQSGYELCVENVGWNAATPAAELERWQRSMVHDKNLLDRRVGVMGIGVQSGYVTFIACRARANPSSDAVRDSGPHDRGSSRPAFG